LKGRAAAVERHQMVGGAMEDQHRPERSGGTRR
jgi:hypothetical protein